MYAPTPEQIEAVALASKHETMKLLAYAGAGKTSTLILIANELGLQGRRGYYLAFNKAIQLEAERKMPANTISKTFHGLAYSHASEYIKNRLNLKTNVQDFAKLFDLQNMSIRVYDMVVNIGAVLNNEKNAPEFIKGKARSVNFSTYQQKMLIESCLKRFLRSDDEYPTVEHIEKTIDKEMDELHEDSRYLITDFLYRKVVAMWEDCLTANGRMGLAGWHDVYLKLWALTKPVLDTDFILFDEAQDADPLMLQILGYQTCQIIYVGDSYQQIYGWRGAHNVMQNLDVALSHLTQSFRFGESLARTVQPLLDFLGSDKQLQGTPTIQTVIDKTTVVPKDFDAILCRTNAGVMEAVMRYRGDNIKVHPVNLNAKEAKEYLTAINDLKERHYTSFKLLSGFQSYEELKSYLDEYKGDNVLAKYVSLYEDYGLDLLLHVITESEKEQRNKIYNNNVNYKVACTAHGAKGLEWDSVFLYNDFIGMFLDKETDMFKVDVPTEEYRLLYVAITRAKTKAYLYHVESILQDIESRLEAKKTNKPYQPKVAKTHKRGVNLDSVKEALMSEGFLNINTNDLMNNEIDIIKNDKVLMEIFGNVLA